MSSGIGEKRVRGDDEVHSPSKRIFPKLFSSTEAFGKQKSVLLKDIVKNVGIEDLDIGGLKKAYAGDTKDETVLLIDGGSFFGTLMVSENHGYHRKTTETAKHNGDLCIRKDTVEWYMRNAVDKFRDTTNGFTRVCLVMDELRNLPKKYTIHKKLTRKSRTSDAKKAGEKREQFCKDMSGEGGERAFFGDAHFDARVSLAYPGDTPLRPDLVNEIPGAASAQDLRTVFSTADGTVLMPGPYSAIRGSSKGRRELHAAVIARIINAISTGALGDVVLRVVGTHSIPVYEALTSLRSAHEDEFDRLFRESLHEGGIDTDDEALASINNNNGPPGAWTPPGFRGRHLIIFSGYTQETAMQAFPFLDTPISDDAPGIHAGAFFVSIDAQGCEMYGESDHGLFMCASACSKGQILWPMELCSDVGGLVYNEIRQWPSQEVWRKCVIPRSIVIYSADSDLLYLSLIWWCWAQLHAESGNGPPHPPLFWARGVNREAKGVNKKGESVNGRPVGLEKIVRVAQMAQLIAERLGVTFSPLASAAHRIINQKMLDWATPEWQGERKRVMFHLAPKNAREIILSVVMIVLTSGFNDYMSGVMGVGSTSIVNALFNTGIARSPFVSMRYTDTEFRQTRVDFASARAVVDENTGACAFVDSREDGLARASSALHWVIVNTKRKKSKETSVSTPNQISRAQSEQWLKDLKTLATDRAATTPAILAKKLSQIPPWMFGCDMWQQRTRASDDLPFEGCQHLLHTNETFNGPVLAAKLCTVSPLFYQHPPSQVPEDFQVKHALGMEKKYAISKKPRVFPVPLGESEERASLALAIINLTICMCEGNAAAGFDGTSAFYRENGDFVYSATSDS